MDYSAARNKIQSGDLIAFRGRSWIGWLIKAITGGAWSHVAIAWWFRDRLFLLEAIDGRGVGIRAASVAAPFDHIKTEIEWTPIMEDRALALLGKPYSYRDFIRAGLGLRLGDPHGEICSEYAARILRLGDAPFRRYPASPTPSNLVGYFQKRGLPLQVVE